MKQYTKYRFLSGLLATLVVVFAYGSTKVSAAPDVVRLYIAPASQNVVSGNSVTVQVRLSKAANAKVDYAKADMVFSSNNLEIISVSRSGSYFNATGGPVTSFNNSKGTVNISGSGDTLPTNADVLVASVTFRAKSAGTGSVSFTGASVAGDLLGSGNVKNALTATAGATIGISSPPSTPAPTQPKPSSPAPSQTPSPTTPPATPESNPEAEPTPVAQVQNESDPGIQRAETVVDATPTPEQPVQLWQWILSGLITVGAIGGIAYVLITKKHEHLGMLPDSAPEALPADIPTDTGDAEISPVDSYAVASLATQFPQAVPEVLAYPEPEPEPEPEPAAAPVFVPQEPTQAIEPLVVEGVEIEPLDQTWPVRLNPTPAVVSPAEVGVGQNVVAQPLSPDVQLQPPVIEQPYVVQAPPAAAPPLPLPPMEQPIQVAPQPVIEQLAVPQAPVVATQPDEYPDMFEEGAARLSAEGFDEQLRPKIAA